MEMLSEVYVCDLFGRSWDYFRGVEGDLKDFWGGGREIFSG